MEKSSFSPPDGGNKDTPDVDTFLNMLQTPIHELVHFSDDWAPPPINPPPPSPFSEASVVEGEYFAACYGLPIRGGPVVIVPSFAPATTTTSLAPSSSSFLFSMSDLLVLLSWNFHRRLLYRCFQLNFTQIFFLFYTILVIM